MPEIGDVFANKYRLVRLLGEGGMGQVFEAHHEQLGKRVAVKFVHDELARDSEVMSRFKREARAAAAIGHRSIVDVYDVGVDADCAYLVMEFLEGESLGDVVERHKVLTVEYSAYVVCQVLSALDVVHANGIIHRDLKPDNVFLVETGQTLPNVKLLDFGISKVLDPAKLDEKLTATGMLVGTPRYMAPEQALGRPDVDHRADLYSTGVMLYECLCGCLPFSGNNAVELLFNVVNEPVVPPRTHNPELPAALEAAVLRAMASDRNARYPNAAAMLADLRAFVSEQGLAQISMPESLRRPGDAATPAAMSAAASLRSASGQVAPSTAITRPDGVGADTALSWGKEHATQPGRGPRLGIWLAAAVLTVIVIGAVTGVLIPMIVGDDSRAAAPSLPDAAAEESAPPAPQPAAQPAAPVVDAAAQPQPDSVTITLVDVPDGATVLLDGAGVDGTVLHMPRSTVLREVRVETADGRSWRHMITPDADRSYPVRLSEPARAKRPRRPRDTRPASPTPPASSAPAKRSGPRGFHNRFE